ncbi:hypothetical protein BN8_01147 [Fibrisoma limi BUZ 3]|uniref:DUF4178 domain-containing protein n=1 Tax=Fibrisoma limi BUZ 3 TaxID=1185876 RepID=I2GE48_9BACT|nr:DUF4178 domain-containing protein [Fibrisoma limi]CCH52173.1 hypothetical protein BN8_01147 [Fibrisoma limi BUZ 3]
MTDAVPSGQTPPSATLDCPRCQSAITYYDVKGSSFYGCPTCHTFFKYEYEGPPNILTTFASTTSLIPIPIGTEGYLDGQFMRVVGFMRKKETTAPYEWTEYMLLRQNGRYAQLAEYNGHWMYVEPIDKKYTEYHTTGKAYYVDTEQRQYRLYNRYKATVLDAVGEFDWNILDDEELTISEYIHPPFMLISEQNGSRSDWYVARYIRHTDIVTAFDLSEDTLPTPYGVGAIQPADPKGRWDALLSFTGMAVVVLLLIQAVISFSRPSRQLFNETYQTEPVLDSASVSFKPIVTPTFSVDGPAVLTIDLRAELANQWLELPMSLINDQTGKTYELTKALEYYYGREGGENWSEGSRTDDAVLSRIPSGRYHLNIYPATAPGNTVSFRVTVKQNPMLWSNLIILLLLLCLYPAILYWRRQWYEQSRWSNSDFSDIDTNE